MTSPAEALNPPTSPDEPALPGEGPAHEAPPSAPAADEPRIHLYEAVSTQRDKVLDSFDAQRAAILKAVADQRSAALAPITAVNVKRATHPRPVPTNAAIPPSPGNLAASSTSMIGTRERRQLMADVRQAVAAQIVAALKLLVAGEVRAQLDAALLASPAPRERSQSASGDTEPAAGEKIPPRDYRIP